MKIIGGAGLVAPTPSQHDVGDLPTVGVIVVVIGNAVEDFNRIDWAKCVNVPLGETIPGGVRHGDIGPSRHCPLR